MEAYTKLRFSSATCASFHEDLFFQLSSFTKTCSFGTYLERGSIFCARLQFHEDSFLHEDNHFALWLQVFVIIKTSLRRSLDDQLYISSFGSVLWPLRTLTSSASSLQRLLSGGHLATGCTLSASVLLWLWTLSQRTFAIVPISFGQALQSWLLHLEVGTRLKQHIPSRDFFQR